MNKIKESIRLRKNVEFTYDNYKCTWRFVGGLDYIYIEMPFICSYKGVAKNKQISACSVIHVEDEHKNQHHATHLLETLERICEVLSYESISLFASNEQMVHIAKKLGYIKDNQYYIKHLE